MRRWTLAIALALSAAGVAHAGWEGAEWGMTPEAVAAALGDRAKPGKGARGDQLGEFKVGNVGEITEGALSYRVVYYYRDGGLAQVIKHPLGRDCKPVIAALLARYGQPRRISDQVILKLVIWHDKSTETRIRLLLSGDPAHNICDVHYEPLSGYEAIDNAAAAGKP